MKQCIITPTYSEHFKYLKKYLSSFDKYVIDKKFPIYFIISSSEKEAFFSIIKPYSDLNINIIYFEDLLNKYNIPYSPTELLQKYDKYCYQTMKKLYAMMDLDFDQYLIIDSESMWVHPVNMSELFKEYFKKPYFGYSSLAIREIKQPFQKILIENINYILKQNSNLWFLETFAWFIDKKILQQIIKECGSPFEMCNKLYQFRNCDKSKIALFEGLLYYQFIYYHNDKYNYNIFNFDKELNNYLKEFYEDYLRIFKKKCSCNGGIIEFFVWMLNKNNFLGLSKMFLDKKIKILRWEDCYYNTSLQKKLYNKIEPYILVVSQDHIFGENNTILNRFNKLICSSKYFKKIVRKSTKAIYPLKAFFSWICNLIQIIGLIIKIFIIILKKSKDVLFN